MSARLTIEPSAQLFDRVGEDRLRVVHVTAAIDGGRWMAELMRDLSKLNIDVEAVLQAEGSLSKLSTEYSIKYNFVPMTWCFTLSSIPEYVASVYRLAWYLWRQKYDIVHSHFFPSFVIARIAAWIADVPVRLSMLPGNLLLEARLPRQFEELTAWMDTRIIGSCKYTNELYLRMGRPPEQLELIYYGIDSDKFNPQSLDSLSCKQKLVEAYDFPPGAKIIGMVAYFYAPLVKSDYIPESLWGVAVKNHEMLLRAVPKILERQPDARFLFVGTGWGADGKEYFEKFQQSIIDRNLQEYVRLTGHVEDVPSLLAGIDISVQCSFNENLGGTTESLLMQKPMVATNVGGMPDAVIHEETGLLVESNDSDGLADAILRLLSEPAFANRLGIAGREHMLTKFSLAPVTMETIQLYTRLVLDRKIDGWKGQAYRPLVFAFRAMVALPIILRIALVSSKNEWKAQLDCRLMFIKYTVINAFLRAKGAVVARKQVTSMHVANGFLTAKAAVLTPCIIGKAHTINRYLQAKASVKSSCTIGRAHAVNTYLKGKSAIVSPCTIGKAHTINFYLHTKHAAKRKGREILERRRVERERLATVEEERALSRLSNSGLTVHGAGTVGILRYFRSTLKSAYEYRYAISMFVANNLKRRYRGSLIGFCWGLVAPLTTMVILSVVFSAIFHTDIHKIGLYIFSGLLPWTFFQESLLRGSQCFLSADSFLRKLMIPKLFFPLVSVAGDTINLILSLVALFALGLAIGFKLHATVFLLPLVIGIFAVFTLGLVLLSAVYTVYLRDLPHIMQVFLSAGFYLLPIIYDMESLPPSYRPVFMCNPLYWFVGLFRSVLCYGKVPSRMEWLLTSAMAIISLVMGIMLLRKREDDLIYRL